MTQPLDIRPDHLQIVKNILREHLPEDIKVWIFGSRSDWTTKDSSDLDIALEGNSALDSQCMSTVEDAFEDSDLPYTVDIVDINNVSDDFRQIIDFQKVPLQISDRRNVKEERDDYKLKEPLDISPDDLTTVRKILAEHVPDLEVKAFGSRASWTARQYSDLDLVLMTDEPLDVSRMASLREAFIESNLPYIVDIVDWASASESFRETIEQECIVVQKEEKLIANEWHKTPLKDVAELIMGQSPPSSTYNEHGDGVPFFQGVKDFNYRHPSLRVFCSKPSRIAQPGDILFSVRAPIGRVNIADRKCAIGRGLAIIRPCTKSDARYIEFALRSMEAKWDAIESSGSVFGNATKQDMETLTLPWPINKQERYTIANILGALDDKIELNRKMSETLEEMARALFKSWFVDFDPVRAKMEGRWRRGESLPGLPADLWELFPSSVIKSETGEIPEGWEFSTIGQEVDVVGGSTPSTKVPSFWNGDINWATPKDLSSLRSPILINTSRKITPRGLAKISSGLLPKGTVLLSSRAPIGYIAITDTSLAINQGFIAMKCRKRLSLFYIWLWTYTNMGAILNNANGSTFQEISKSNFRPLPIIVPSEPIRQAYDQAIKTLYHRIVINECLSQTLAGIRDTLLSKLVSGELRVT